MRTKSKKVFFRKLLKFVILVIIIYFVLDKLNIFNKFDTYNGESININYSGEGQKKVKNKDGYYTTFITDNSKKYIEYKQGGKASWAQKEYWGGTMEENGCGITSLAIIASAYDHDITPEDLRKKYVPHLDGENISKELKNTLGIECSDFYFANYYFSKEYIFEHLQKDKPILICVWNKPDEKWTEKSHYMVLLATDGNDKVYVSNPNDKENEPSSGWYKTEKILPYIAKALFIEE